MRNISRTCLRVLPSLVPRIGYIAGGDIKNLEERFDRSKEGQARGADGSSYSSLSFLGRYGGVEDLIGFLIVVWLKIVILTLIFQVIGPIGVTAIICTLIIAGALKGRK